MSDKTVAELMALHRVAVEAAVALDVADSFGSGSTKEQLSALRADAAAADAALEQAIRRAVDWGEPQAWITKGTLDGKKKLEMGEASTNPAYVKTHKEWAWTPLYARRQDQ